jgi:hypothetical protein
MARCTLDQQPHTMAKPKFERIKNKIVEFFWAKSDKQALCQQPDLHESFASGRFTDEEYDDLEANLFDRELMIKYIGSFLLWQIKQSELVRYHRLDLRMPTDTGRDVGLMYHLASRVYAQCNTEPCGIRGCRLAINLTLNDASNHTHRLLDNVRFDTTTTMTTFELELNLWEDARVLCLRRILPRAMLFDRIHAQSAIYLDRTFDLVKRKLY